jgi:hypothetical protein
LPQRLGRVPMSSAPLAEQLRHGVEEEASFWSGADAEPSGSARQHQEKELRSTNVL